MREEILAEGARSDLELIADAVERIAFKMPAPNPYTPQFVQIAIAARRLAQQSERSE